MFPWSFWLADLGAKTFLLLKPPDLLTLLQWLRGAHTVGKSSMRASI